MNVPVWAARLAAEFWSQAGDEEPFPRSLRHAIARAVPLTIVSLPHLATGEVAGWLESMNVPFQVSVPGRALHGMLVTFRGCGFVFLDGDDDEDEQRFTLAHELSHYLRDDWRPRERVRRCLGVAGLEVLDGDRAANLDERVVGALDDFRLGPRVHLLERTAKGAAATRIIDQAEYDADRLAFELLAPATHVANVGLAGRPRSEWSASLQRIYRLPKWAADRYVDLLCPGEPASSLIASLAKGSWQ